MHLHGGRFSHLLAAHLAAHLEQLRPGVRLLTDPRGRDLGSMMELTRRDVVVLFDYHRYQRSAADLAAAVHRAGATVVLITDDLACPVAPDAEVVLAASSTVGTVYQSMAAGFLLTELLIPWSWTPSANRPAPGWRCGSSSAAPNCCPELTGTVAAGRHGSHCLPCWDGWRDEAVTARGA